MSVASYAKSVLRAPGQDNFRNGRRARFWFYNGVDKRACPNKDNAGFTLIELLVVIVIIAILAAILFPVFVRVKATAHQTKCLSNLKQLTSAWLLYADNNNGRACPSYYNSGGWSYAWDFITKGNVAKDGLLSRYAKSQELKKCPAFKGQSWNRPFTGYAYNDSYIGRIINPDTYMAPQPPNPCLLNQITQPTKTVVFADAGFGNPVQAHNFLRSPYDSTTGDYTNGTVHFRHNGRADVAYADGHVSSTSKKYNTLNYAQECGTLSVDDSAYDLK